MLREKEKKYLTQSRPSVLLPLPANNSFALYVTHLLPLPRPPSLACAVLLRPLSTLYARKDGPLSTLYARKDERGLVWGRSRFFFVFFFPSTAQNCPSFRRPPSPMVMTSTHTPAVLLVALLAVAAAAMQVCEGWKGGWGVDRGCVRVGVPPYDVPRSGGCRSVQTACAGGGE